MRKYLFSIFDLMAKCLFKTSPHYNLLYRLILYSARKIWHRSKKQKKESSGSPGEIVKRNTVSRAYEWESPLTGGKDRIGR